MKQLGIEEDLMTRAVNEGFSGGEKKKNEIFQMARARPDVGDPRRNRFRGSTLTR